MTPIVADGLWGAYDGPRFFRNVYFAPLGLYAAPQQARSLRDTIAAVLASTRSVTTASLRWNVRYDHSLLADELRRAGLHCTTASTHVLACNDNYDAVFSRYNATRRNEVRRARREGVTVREAHGTDDVRAYYRIHRELSTAKGRPMDYPYELFCELAALDDSLLLLAERNSTVLGGGMFFRDGDHLFYWHGASDRSHATLFPTCAILDRAISIAIEQGLASVNFGASPRMSTLEAFKGSWGAVPTRYWKFEWTSPLARPVRHLRRGKALVGKLLRGWL